MSDGELIIDEFQLVNCIITGTNTSVWEASEQGSGSRYAIKLLLPDAFNDPEQKAALKHEAKVGQSLDHPNFVKFHKVVINKKYGYIVMDYFRSMNLKTALQGDLTAIHARIRRLFDTVCQAVGYMHDQGWLHRDIKPDNILFNKASEVRLIDFSLAARAPSGLSKLLSRKVKFVQGTRTYIAPETIQKRPASIQTDIYSLGVTLFEILTGTPPFKGSSPDDLLKKHISAKPPAPSLLNRNVTPQMDQLVLRMLAKKPENRPKNMQDVNAELRNVKIFHEDVVEGQLTQEEQERAQNQRLAEATKLDSRADAERQEIYRQNPELAPKKPPKPAAKPVAAPAPPKPQPAQQPAAPYPPGGYPPPGYAPQYPPQYQPQYQQPGQFPPVAYPGYMPPGYAPPPGAPQQPQGQPPQGQPPHGHYPQGQYPPGQPAPGQTPQPYPPYAAPQPYPGQGGQAPVPQQNGPQQTGPQPAGPQSAQPQSPAGPPPQSGPAPQSGSAPQSGPAPAPPPAGEPSKEEEKKRNDDDLPFMEELPDII